MQELTKQPAVPELLSAAATFASLAICHDADTGVSHLMVLTKAGRFFLFSRLDFSALRAAIGSHDLPQVDQLKSAIQLRQGNVSHLHDPVQGGSVKLVHDTLRLLFWGKGFSVWSEHEGTLQPTDHINRLLQDVLVLDCAMTEDQKCLLMLDADGRLRYVPSRGLVCTKASSNSKTKKKQQSSHHTITKRSGGAKFNRIYTPSTRVLSLLYANVERPLACGTFPNW